MKNKLNLKKISLLKMCLGMITLLLVFTIFSNFSEAKNPNPPVPEHNPNCPETYGKKIAVVIPGFIFAAAVGDFLASDPSVPRADAGVTKEVLDYTCGEGDWLIVYEEDDNGDPVPGSGEADCVTKLDD